MLAARGQSPASVRKRAFLPSPEHHVTSKKTRQQRVWMDPDGIPTRRILRSSPLLSQLRILGLSDHRVQIACTLLFTKGPVIFAPYLRMRSVAPLVDAHSLFYGKQTRVLWA